MHAYIYKRRHGEEINMDDKILKFNQKLKDLLAYAKKKNNILEQQEVISFFSDVLTFPAFDAGLLGRS